MFHTFLEIYSFHRLFRILFLVTLINPKLIFQEYELNFEEITFTIFERVAIGAEVCISKISQREREKNFSR